VDRSSAEGALVEVPKAPRRGVAGSGQCWEGMSPPRRGRALGRGLMMHFGAVFKLDLTEETRTQSHEEEACIHRPKPMDTLHLKAEMCPHMCVA